MSDISTYLSAGRQDLNEGYIEENSPTMSTEKCGTLDDLSDVLIIQKIKQSDHSKVPSTDTLTATQCLCFRSGCDCEINQLAEEQEALRIKEYQMLQADERGKQALIKEISALKQKQEERAELIRNRQRALDAEKERSKKIASLPPPLPKSVKLLLKQCNEEPKRSKPYVQMPDELTAVTINPVEYGYENKENIVDPKELEAKQKVLEEQQMIAKKRFNEALKKDRQKQEYSNVMKQIQNAELLNRREMAKSISSEKKGLPCAISDKFQYPKRQAHLESATEKIFQKTGIKEHIIEEIEGYQDYYEEKYKKIDSSYEAKMTDCIPDFIKENYEYLLEDESNFTGGKKFSELEDDDNAIDNILNLGYIESPPAMDEVDGREKIDLAISNLDKLRSNLQEEYEQTVKPLLRASMEVSKKELSDKAVETELFKVHVEDKAIETDGQFKAEQPSPKTPPIFDYKNSGVMAHRRRPHIPTFKTLKDMGVPSMHKREVRYAVPSPSVSGDLGTGSWSSSSYCSLPSKHGIPTFNSSPEFAKCDICVAEKEDTKRDFSNRPSHGIITTSVEISAPLSSTEKPPLSKYVKKIAEKYLVPKTTSGSTSKEDNSNVESPAFEKEVIGKTQIGVFEQQKSEELRTNADKPTMLKTRTFQSLPIITDKSVNVLRQDKEMSVPDPVQTSCDSGTSKHFDNKHQENLYEDIKNFTSPMSSPEYSDYQLECKRMQAINEVLSRRFPRFTLDSSPKFEESKDVKDSEKPSFAAQNLMDINGHVYHELSTIQELDSALTAGSLQLSQSKLPDTSDTKAEQRVLGPEESKDLVQSAEKMKVASLLDPPYSEIAELARSIHFVPETKEKSTETIKSVSSEPFNVKSASSRDVSWPSCSSSSSNSISSFSSGAKIFSSTLTGNQLKHPHLKDIKTLPIYFKDISDVQKKMSNSGKSFSSLPSSEFLSSTPESTPSQSIPSVVHARSKENKDAPQRLMPEYIDSSKVPENMKLDSSSLNQKKKDPSCSVMSGYISDIEVPEITKSDIPHSSSKKNNAQSIVSGYISDIETQSESDRAIFHPMTPHFNISTPETYGSKNVMEPHEKEIKNLGKIPDLKYGQVLMQSSSGSFKRMTPQSNISSPRELVSLGSKHGSINSGTSAGSFKALSSHYNISSPSESDSFSKNFKVLTPHSDVSSPVESVHQGFKSAGSFKPLTPHSNVSSPPEYDYRGYKSAEGFKPLTPHSDVSSPPEYDYRGYKSVEGFKPLTPHSDVSSPPEYDYRGYKSAEGFKPLTPHSDVSSPPEYDYQGSKSAESFKPLTPQSDVSSPTTQLASLHNPESEQSKFRNTESLTPKIMIASVKEIACPYKNEPQSSASSTGSLKELTPKSTISSVVSSDEVEIGRKISTANSELHSLIMRLDISTNSFSPNNNGVKSMKLPLFNCNLAFKTNIPTNHVSPIKIMQSDTVKKAVTEKIHCSNEDDLTKQVELYKLKQNVHPSSSDFFVPSLSKCLTKLNKNKHWDTVRETSDCDKANAKETLQSETPALSVKDKNNKIISDQKQSINIESKILEENALKKNVKEKESIDQSKESSKNKNLHESETARSIKPNNNLQAVSSTSSSTENLSEISGSKVVYQSTPVKRFSELVEEPGILEEPDLTLMTTDLTCKMDSTAVPRDLSTSVPPNPSADEVKHLKVTPSQIDCQNPGSVNPQNFGSPDTPSMISFLRHEMSCQESGESSPNEDINAASSNVQSKQQQMKEVKRSLFQKDDYKQRTKRLWENLEEVKKKNLRDEKRRMMEINRKKAKEFAKKLKEKTPKGK